ncbi:MAG: aldo/keto reductase [Streptosporangiales bacterium]|nr:aldo/keto reductase [Streptosporangiales bacterium]MBO0890264.1 aldo/keto reductase [Acidothermales bacterium]
MADMTYRRLGDSGLTVSTVGLGCNAFGARVDADGVREVVDAAYDAGITFFDTADIYGTGASEELLGAALAGRRDDVVLATKFGKDMHGTNGRDFGARGSRRYIRTAVEASLRRLGTDHIDLYQMHEPDPATPVEESLDALTELVREGKVRYVGSSQFAAWQVADADWTARAGGAARMVSTQENYNLLERDVERELVPACERFGVGLIPYFPLARGLLTGKYRRGEPAPEGTNLAGRAGVLEGADFDRIEALQRFADDRRLTMAAVAVAGLAAQPAVATVIAGATKPSQVVANAAAAQWEPTPDDLAELDEIMPGPAAPRGR